MFKFQSKKGALELSMNTIVIIVIGVTLLILGLAFVRGVFSKVSGLAEGAFEKAEGQIGVDADLKDTLTVQPPKISVASGASKTTTIILANLGTKDSGSVTLTVNPVTSTKMKSDDIECIFLENGDTTLTVDPIASGKFRTVNVKVATLDNVKLGDKACKFLAKGIEGATPGVLSITVTK